MGFLTLVGAWSIVLDLFDDDWKLRARLRRAGARGGMTLNVGGWIDVARDVRVVLVSDRGGVSADLGDHCVVAQFEEGDGRVPAGSEMVVSVEAHLAS